MDNVMYDYNGVGEYWLIKSPALYVQVRLVQTVDSSNKPVNASAIGACAIQVPQGINQNISDRVHVQLAYWQGKLLRISVNGGSEPSKVFCEK
jgi:hypothetical protein